MKPIKIMLDIERELKFGSKAFITMEKLAGKPMDKIEFETQESTFVMIGAGLAHNFKNITIDKVCDIIDKATEKVAEEEGLSFMDAYSKVMERVAEAMSIAFPNGE